MKIIKFSIAILLVFDLLIFPSTALGGKEAGSTTEQLNLSEKQKILLSALSFRSGILTSYKASLDQYASAESIAWFNSMDEEWWQNTPPGVIWQRLMLDAQMVYSNLSPNALVLYYSAWSDVFLITEWKVVEGVAKIIDTEIVSGDFFRNSIDEEISSTPMWLRSPPYLLNAITTSTVISLQKANKIFLNAEVVNWRRFSGLEDKLNNTRLMSSQLVAKRNVLSNFYNIMEFNGSKEADISSVRFNIYYLLASIKVGRVEEYLADKSISVNDEVKGFLNKVKGFSKVSVVAHVKIKGGSWVFVTYSNFPYVALAVFLNKGVKGKYIINQIEAINFAGAYNYDN